jgi:Holliday junction resolvase-like predicted endonuclease
MRQIEIPLENTFNLEQASLGNPLWGTPLFEPGMASRLKKKPLDPMPDFNSLLIRNQTRGRIRASKSMEETVRGFLIEQNWKIHEDKEQYWDRRGIDIIAYKNRTVLLIQCKLRRGGLYLTLPIMMKLLGSVTAFKNEHRERIETCGTAVYGILIGTTASSTAAAKVAEQNELYFFKLGLH